MSQATAVPAAKPALTGEQVPCPRCQQPLIDPHGLGWCKACGYCRSLAETEKEALREPKPARAAIVAPPGGAPAIPMARRIARHWAWGLLLGVVLIAGATYAGGRLLKLTPLERALLTSLQMAFGFLVMFVGQFIGLLRVAPDDSTLTFWDAVFPFRLYGLIFKHLPATRLTVNLGSWGLTAMLAAGICIGGLEHWFNYLPGNQKNKSSQVQRPR